MPKKAKPKAGEDTLLGYAWPGVIEKHIEHWATRPDAREYANDDIVYTRALDKHFGFPTPGDNDSTLACMVPVVRWHGFTINREGMGELLAKAEAVIANSPVNINKPGEVRAYVTAAMDATEAIVLEESTKKANLEAISKNWEIEAEEPCGRCDGKPGCARCGGTGVLKPGRHPAAVRAKTILDVKIAAKEKELYEKLLLAGKFHASFVVIGTLSSRMAGGDGLNAQGIKAAKDVRKMFPLFWPGTDPVWRRLRFVRGDDRRRRVQRPRPAQGLDYQRAVSEVRRHRDRREGRQALRRVRNDRHDAAETPRPVRHGLVGRELRRCHQLRQHGERLVRQGQARRVCLGVRRGLEHPGPEIGRDRGAGEACVCGLREAIPRHRQGPQEPSTPSARCGGQAVSGLRWSGRRRPNISKPSSVSAATSPWKTKFARQSRPGSQAAEAMAGVQGQGSAARSRPNRRWGGRQRLYGSAFQMQAANMRAAANHEIQSPGAEITKSVQRRLWDLQPAGIHPLRLAPLNVHDELMVVAMPSVVHDITANVREVVESYRAHVPLLGMSWFEAMENWAEKKGGHGVVKIRPEEMM